MLHAACALRANFVCSKKVVSISCARHSAVHETCGCVWLHQAAHIEQALLIIGITGLYIYHMYQNSTHLLVKPTHGSSPYSIIVSLNFTWQVKATPSRPVQLLQPLYHSLASCSSMRHSSLAMQVKGLSLMVQPQGRELTVLAKGARRSGTVPQSARHWSSFFQVVAAGQPSSKCLPDPFVHTCAPFTGKKIFP